MVTQRITSQETYDWTTAEILATPAYRQCAYALLRLTLGTLFLFAGIGKFTGGIDAFASRLEQQFAGKLPSLLVVPFGYALPFVEVAVGLLLVLGLFNVVALAVSGLLLAALTFGTVVSGDFPSAAHNVSYALVNFVLLWTADYNKYSLDQLLRRRRLEEGPFQ